MKKTVTAYSSKEDAEKFLAVGNGDLELACPFVWDKPSSSRDFEITISVREINPESFRSKLSTFIKSVKRAFNVLRGAR